MRRFVVCVFDGTFLVQNRHWSSSLNSSYSCSCRPLALGPGTFTTWLRHTKPNREVLRSTCLAHSPKASCPHVPNNSTTRLSTPLSTPLYSQDKTILVVSIKPPNIQCSMQIAVAQLRDCSSLEGLLCHHSPVPGGVAGLRRGVKASLCTGTTNQQQH